MNSTEDVTKESQVKIQCGHRRMEGILHVPAKAKGIVVFAHGSGSGRHSPRNQFVAKVLQQIGLATLLLDLLEEDEAEDREKVFDVLLLAKRLQSAANWTVRQRELASLKLGYFGASTGAGAALVAAARRPGIVSAIVSRGGRPDLAGNDLSAVRAPTLLIVGGNDDVVLQLNEQAAACLQCEHELVVVPGATHLFEEPGTLEEVARLASNWFEKHLAHARPRRQHLIDMQKEVAMFRNREDAGRQLAARLRDPTFRRPLVLAIPRGGIVVGAILADEINAELDVVLSRKLRAPMQPELAIGAVSEGGEVYLNMNKPAREALGIDEEHLRGEKQFQLAEIARRSALFRQVRPRADVSGRSVIVTDDGIATGSTMIAALQLLRAQSPHELIVAIPVASPRILARVRSLCDGLVCLHAPVEFYSIGEFYEDFRQVEDAQVVTILREHYTETQSNNHLIGSSV